MVKPDLRQDLPDALFGKSHFLPRSRPTQEESEADLFMSMDNLTHLHVYLSAYN